VTSWLAIINPKAGGASSRKSTSLVLEELKRGCPGRFDQIVTQYPGHATELAQRAAEEGHSTVFSLGGDGTHNEVLNGLLDPEGSPRNPDLTLGVLNSGTGGDFARFLYSNAKPQTVARALVSTQPSLVDVGRCRFQGHSGEPATRLFLNIGSFGLSGDVVHYVNNSSKLFGGKVSYLLGTAQALIRHTSPQLRLIIDDETPIHERFQVAAVANGQFFGGGMRVAPEADLHDGRFDLVLVENMNLMESLTATPRLYSGTHLNHPQVRMIRAKTLRAESDPENKAPVRLELDGEQPGVLPAVFDILPGRLNLLMPEVIG
jgi:diacylglycerol kinase (ATP)